MSDDTSKQDRIYDVNLQRWALRQIGVLASDRAAVDIGLVTLRTAILVNSGAIVALLAFVGQLWPENGLLLGGAVVLPIVLHGLWPFIVGLGLALFSAPIAYIYQSLVTASGDRQLSRITPSTDTVDETSRLDIWIRVLAILMVGGTAASYGLFCYGAWGIMDALAPAGQP